MTAADLDQVTRALESSELFPDASHPSGVLVVSANLDLRLLLAHHLEGLGYGVWTAGSGRDGLEVGLQHPVAIDALVCDASVSDLQAADLYSGLKARIQGLRCCVLATSTHSRRAEEAARLGAVVLDVGGQLVAQEAQLTSAFHAW